MTTTGAVMMTLAWLMLGRFALGERRMTRSQLDRTLLLWVLPLLIAPPMYSRDVYSYLGAERDLAAAASTRTGSARHRAWASTTCSRCRCRTCGARPRRRTVRCSCGSVSGISALTGENIVAAVLCHRLVVLLGVGLIVVGNAAAWPAAAGSPRSSALWLGAANPLLIMHLVAQASTTRR